MVVEWDDDQHSADVVHAREDEYDHEHAGDDDDDDECGQGRSLCTPPVLLGARIG